MSGDQGRAEQAEPTCAVAALLNAMGPCASELGSCRECRLFGTLGINAACAERLETPKVGM